MDRPRTLSFVNITVAINGSLSGAVDVGANKIVGLICPAAIEATTTNVSLAAAPALAGTYNVVKPDGVKWTKPFAVNDYLTFANLSSLLGIRWVKIQLETAAGAAVVQATAARTFQLILEAL